MRKLFFLLVVLIVATVGFGFYRGWFTADVAKIKADASKASEKASELGEKAKEKIEGIGKDTTANGDLAAVDEKDSSFTLTTEDGKKLTLHVDADTKIQLKKESARLKDLKAGDRVTATYKVKDGKNLAHSVTVERGK